MAGAVGSEWRTGRNHRKGTQGTQSPTSHSYQSLTEVAIMIIEFRRIVQLAKATIAEYTGLGIQSEIRHVCRCKPSSITPKSCARPHGSGNIAWNHRHCQMENG